MKKHRIKTVLAASLTSISVASTGQSQIWGNEQSYQGETEELLISTVGTQKDQLKIQERALRGVVILVLIGKFKAGESNVVLRKAISARLMKREKHFLLNLAGVTSIDEIGIKGLVSNLSLVGRVKGQLKLLNLTEKIQDLLTTTNLSTAFDVYDVESEAVDSFTSSTQANTQTGSVVKTPCKSTQELEKRVREIIVSELGVKEKEVIANARFKEDLGADSLDLVELVMRYEEEFAIKIPDEDGEKLVRVKDVYDYLCSRKVVPDSPAKKPNKPKK